MGSKQRPLGIVFAGLAVLALAGCDAEPEQSETAAPLQVSVLTLQAHELSVSEDLPARVAAVRSAEIRAQIGGIVQRRLFEQGAEIKAGAVLFQINPAPFKAEVDSAVAAVQRAEATLARARVQAERLKPLVQAEAVSRQVYDDAVALRAQAAADVAQAKATLARRKLDLQFASVEAPIAGRIDPFVIHLPSILKGDFHTFFRPSRCRSKVHNYVFVHEGSTKIGGIDQPLDCLHLTCNFTQSSISFL